MAEKAKTPATKKNSTAKKSTASKKDTTTSKAAGTNETKPKEKEFTLDTMICCKSVRQNELFYKSASGMRYVWSGFGDVREIPYQEIISMRASRSAFLYEPWLIIEDEDLMKKPEFKEDFDDLYALYDEFGEPKKFFEQPVSDIERKLKDAPRGLRDLVVYNASTYIQDGTLDSLSVISTIDRVFGTNLKMLI